MFNAPNTIRSSYMKIGGFLCNNVTSTELLFTLIK